MKCASKIFNALDGLQVASYMDAWIEIDGETHHFETMAYVASYMDAWIEILAFSPVASQFEVASYMDAWIEISSWARISASSYSSHPIWMRGLKYAGLMQAAQLGRRILYGCVD